MTGRLDFRMESSMRIQEFPTSRSASVSNRSYPICRQLRENFECRFRLCPSATEYDWSVVENVLTQKGTVYSHSRVGGQATEFKLRDCRRRTGTSSELDASSGICRPLHLALIPKGAQQSRFTFFQLLRLLRLCE